MLFALIIALAIIVITNVIALIFDVVHVVTTINTIGIMVANITIVMIAAIIIVVVTSLQFLLSASSPLTGPCFFIVGTGCWGGLDKELTAACPDRSVTEELL